MAERRDRLLTAREVITKVYGRTDIATPTAVYKWATTGVRVRSGLGQAARSVVRLEGAIQTPRGVMYPESCVDRFMDMLQDQMQRRAETSAATPPADEVDAEIEARIRESRKSKLHPTRARKRRRANTTSDA